MIGEIMANTIYGYARVSTKDQHIERQILELEKYVPDRRDIIIDKSSGKDFNRQNYQALRRFIKPGDTIYIKSLDRFGRNKNMIKEELQYFQKHGVYIRCLDIPTTLIDYSGFGELQKAVFDMVNNILIEVLGTMYEQERKNTKQRQKEGIAAAKLKGRVLGRPETPMPEKWDQVYKAWQGKEITAVAAMRALELKPATFYRMVKRFQNP